MISYLFTGMMEYMVNQSTPATRPFASMKELHLFLSEAQDPAVVALLPNGEEGKEWDAYLEVANMARGVPIQFWYCTRESLATGLGLPQEGGMVVARPLRYC